VKHGRLELRRNLFSVRVIESRNRKPAGIKSEPKIALFRSKYKKLRAFSMQPAAERVDWRERRDENETIMDWKFPERPYLGPGGLKHK
jgi:hypothetical protein